MVLAFGLPLALTMRFQTPEFDRDFGFVFDRPTAIKKAFYGSLLMADYF